jgi:hypothetical protein
MGNLFWEFNKFWLKVTVMVVMVEVIVEDTMISVPTDIQTIQHVDQLHVPMALQIIHIVTTTYVRMGQLITQHVTTMFVQTEQLTIPLVTTNVYHLEHRQDIVLVQQDNQDK